MRTIPARAARRRSLVGGAAVLLALGAGVSTAAAATAASPASAGTQTSTATAPAAGPVSRGSGWAELTPSQQGEQRMYWCGPAALVSTLKESGHGARTQTWAAGVLNTTTNGTDMGNMLSALNAYSGGFKYDEVFESGAWSSYVSGYESHLKSDINCRSRRTATRAMRCSWTR